MQYVCSCIDQLDLAGLQLRQDNPAYRRFALILTDNIVELLAYRRCRDEFRLRMLDRNNPKFSMQAEKEILGNDFGKKIRFLHDLGKITDYERVFIINAHSYRNESYHTGIVHDDVIHALAWHYHKVACDLFPRLRPGMIGYRESDVISDTVKRHLGKDQNGFYLLTDEDFQRASQSLAMTRPLPEPNLSEVLASSALKRIQRVEDALAYVVKNDPDGKSHDVIIREIQYWKDFKEKQPEGGYNLNDPAMVALLQERKHYMHSQWKPRITSSPVERWKTRASRLMMEKNIANALQKLDGIRRDISYFEEVVLDAAAALDAYIDHQIDMMRGK